MGFVFSPRQGTTAPSAIESVRSGRMRSGSKVATLPRPSQVGQAP